MKKTQKEKSGKQKDEKGFIALISVIIVSAILMLVATTLSLGGFFTRFNVFNSEIKDRSNALAEACVDEAFIQTAKNPSYSGGDTLTFTDGDCQISTFTPSTVITFKTKGRFQNSHTNFLISYNTASHSVISWEEIPTY
jgi:hypothetical protein